MNTKQRVSIVAMLLASVGLGGIVGVIAALSTILTEEGRWHGEFSTGMLGVSAILLTHMAFWDETIPMPAVILITAIGAVLGLSIGYTQALDQPLSMMNELYFRHHWPVLIGAIIMRYRND